MTSKEERTELFRLIGLSDQKIEETLKNEQLTVFLVEIIKTVIKKIYLNVLNFKLSFSQ
jgi:hypothetical protein